MKKLMKDIIILLAACFFLAPAKSYAWKKPSFSKALKLSHKQAKSQNESKVIAETLWREARGEGLAGIKAVASVIYFRKKAAKKSFSSVCLKSKQFSCWNEGPKTVKIGPAKAKTQAWKQCRQVADSLVKGSFKPTVKSDHYAEVHCKPSWEAKLQKVKVIGNHKFFASNKLQQK